MLNCFIHNFSRWLLLLQQMLSFDPSYYVPDFQDNFTGRVNAVPSAAVFLCIPPVQAGIVPSNFDGPSSFPWKCANLWISSCWDIGKWESCKAGWWCWSQSLVPRDVQVQAVGCKPNILQKCGRGKNKQKSESSELWTTANLNDVINALRWHSRN